MYPEDGGTRDARCDWSNTLDSVGNHLKELLYFVSIKY